MIIPKSPTGYIVCRHSRGITPSHPSVKSSLHPAISPKSRPRTGPTFFETLRFPHGGLGVMRLARDVAKPSDAVAKVQNLHGQIELSTAAFWFRRVCDDSRKSRSSWWFFPSIAQRRTPNQDFVRNRRRFCWERTPTNGFRGVLFRKRERKWILSRRSTFGGGGWGAQRKHA